MPAFNIGGIFIKTELYYKIATLIDKKVEGEYWDYKQEWHKENERLLADVLCFANTIHNEDCYLIIGVADNGEIIGLTKDSPCRKTQTAVLDLLSNTVFAGDNVPNIAVETIEVFGKEIDILTVFNSFDVPFYIKSKSKKYQSIVNGFIYSRNGDKNTPICENSSMQQIELLWKKRLGLLNPPLKQIISKLKNKVEWEELGSTYYNIYNPDFKILNDMCHEEYGHYRAEFYAYNQYNESTYYSDLKILCRDTVLKEFQILMLDSGRYSIIKNSQINEKDYRSVLARLNKLEVNSCIPLLFDIFNANKLNLIDEKELEMAFIIIENYIVRRTVCGLATNQLNKVFVALSSEIKRYMEKDNVSYFSAFVYAILIKSGKSRFPNNHDFADKFVTYELYNARPTIKKYFMERLENNSTKEKIAVEEQIDNGTLTIEHIMPQRLNSEWKKALGDNWELVHSKYKDTIGNLTLTAYNSDYSNLPFLKKKEMPDKGFNYSKLDLNKYLKNCDFWNEDTITGRSKLLFEVAEQLWWLPETDYSPHEEEQWICWDEDFDFTNMLITKIKFMGDEIDTSNISDAYKKLNTLIYDLDSVTYLSEENVAYSYIENDFRSPLEIASGIYVESNLSSPSKITVICKTAKLYKLESDDIKFLVKAKEKKLVFDITNEDSYASLTVGQLAFKLFENLITLDKVSVEEIELFKDKVYTKSKFNRTDYPAIANNREDNRGVSSNIRYRKTPILFNGTEIYISTQWFEGNREDLIAWYRKHV